MLAISQWFALFTLGGALWALWAGTEGAWVIGRCWLSGGVDEGSQLVLLALGKYWLFYLLSLFPLILAAHASRSTSGDS